ncbi:MAG: hypothetical protein EAZ21_14030 [Betaproteobacteria bacterium]|nr:MAG: hypothetical protein EAZ21_14030 [Betaproteobacteria bacterium]
MAAHLRPRVRARAHRAQQAAVKAVVIRAAADEVGKTQGAISKTSAQLLRAGDTSSKIREKSSRTYVRSGVFANFFLV